MAHRWATEHFAVAEENFGKSRILKKSCRPCYGVQNVCCLVIPIEVRLENFFTNGFLIPD